MINVNTPHNSLLSGGCFEGRWMKPAVPTHLTMFWMFCIWKGPVYSSGADFLMQYDAIFREKWGKLLQIQLQNKWTEAKVIKTGSKYINCFRKQHQYNFKSAKTESILQRKPVAHLTWSTYLYLGRHHLISANVKSHNLQLLKSVQQEHAGKLQVCLLEVLGVGYSQREFFLVFKFIWCEKQRGDFGSGKPELMIRSRLRDE